MLRYQLLKSPYLRLIFECLVIAYTYNNLNQVTQAGDITYTYSDAGNLVSQSQSGILIASYTYDSQNRMTAADAYGIFGTLTETYSYDALGNHIAKTTDGVKTDYVIDYSTGYAQVLRATTDGSSVFYTRDFELISRKDASRKLWYLTDGGGLNFLLIPPVSLETASSSTPSATARAGPDKPATATASRASSRTRRAYITFAQGT